jgi:methyl-accepting chemotaxis protein
MSAFRNLRTGTKVLVGFGLLIGVLALVGVVAVTSLERMRVMLEEEADKGAVGVASAKELSVNLMMIAREIRQPLVERNPAIAAQHARATDRYEGELRRHLDVVRRTVTTDEERARLADVERAIPVYLTVARRILELAGAGQVDAAVAELGQARATVNAAVVTVRALGEATEHAVKATAQRGAALSHRLRWVLLAVVLGGVLAGVAVALVVARSIARPLRATAALLRDLSDGEGDLTVRLPVTSRDEVGALAAGFNAFMDKLHDVVARTRATAEQVAVASRQMSGAVEQLASGSQAQASSLEETAAALEEITGTVKQNADNARQASQLAGGSRAVAEKGGHVVQDAVAAMAAINESSRRIAAIITTIDEIAFQTNLLALNAAVEAARAGEQGRGFAVVASEVRNLAQRSAGAAREIKALIEDSVGKVEAGGALVTRSGATLDEIVGAVKRVTDLVGEIAAASQEQSTGIDQVNRAVGQMDRVVQDTATQTEALSTTAQGLAAQAAELHGLVGRFVVAGGAAAATAAVAGAPEMRRAATGRAAPSRARGGAIAVEHLEAAIAAHGMWKTRLRRAVETRQTDVAVEVAAADDRCKFGTWLMGQPPGARTAVWARVRELHASFHREAARVLAMALAGQRAEAEAALGMDSEFTRLSSRLTEAMLGWKRSVASGREPARATALAHAGNGHGTAAGFEEF